MNAVLDRTGHFARQLLAGKTALPNMAFFHRQPLDDVERTSAVLGALRQVSRTPPTHKAYGIYALLRALIDNDSPVVRALLVREGVPLLNSLTRRLTPACLSWGMAMHALAMIDTAQSLEAWTDHFLSIGPDQPAALGLACAALLCGDAGCEKVLPSRISTGWNCPARRPYVEALTGDRGWPLRLARPWPQDDRAARLLSMNRIDWWPSTGTRRYVYLVRHQWPRPRPFWMASPFEDVIGVRSLIYPFEPIYHQGYGKWTDSLAAACVQELEARGKVFVEVLQPEEQSEYSPLLRRWPLAPLSGPRVVLFAEVSARLRIPIPPIAVAEAYLNGEYGWAVVDGERSAWYSRSHWKSWMGARMALQMHLGQRLLQKVDGLG